MHKKANMPLIIIAVAFVAMLAIGGTVAVKRGVFTGEQKAVGDAEKEVLDKEAQSCSGVSSVNLLYNDQNVYKAGTDPASTLTVTSPDRISVADDAASTTGEVLTHFTGLAGNSAGTPSTSYFSREIAFDTICSDLPIQTELYQMGAPTITVLQDDGITKFTTSAEENVEASTSYTAGFTVKAPAEQCSANYGAAIAVQYDATFIQSVERGGGDIAAKDFGIFAIHAANPAGDQNDTTINGTFDQWKTFEWNGAVQDVDGDGVNDAGYLCDGKKIQFDLKYTTTSDSGVADDAHNLNVSWFAINKDLDADSYDLITGIYDEDNNKIALAEKTARTWTNKN